MGSSRVTIPFKDATEANRGACPRVPRKTRAKHALAEVSLPVQVI